MIRSLIFALLVCITSTFQISYASSLTAVIGTMDMEINPVIRKMDSRNDTFIGGLHFFDGIYLGQRIVAVASGSGKVNSAYASAILIDHFKPEVIISTGVAGAVHPELTPGDIVIAAKTAFHDVGVIDVNGFRSRGMKNPVSEAVNPIFFPANPRLLKQAETAANMLSDSYMVRIGIVVSGDVFVSSAEKIAQLRDEFHADAVDMEAAAVAQICRQFGIPFIAVRGISDRGNHRAPEFFRKFARSSAARAGLLALKIIRQMNFPKTFH